LIKNRHIVVLALSALLIGLLAACKSEGESGVKKVDPVLIKIATSQLWFCPDAQAELDSRALDLKNLTSVDFSAMQQLATGKGYEMSEVRHKFVDNKISNEWRTGGCNIERPPKGSKEYSFRTPDTTDGGGLAYFVSVTPDQKIWSIVSSTTVSLAELVREHTEDEKESRQD